MATRLAARYASRSSGKRPVEKVFSQKQRAALKVPMKGPNPAEISNAGLTPNAALLCYSFAMGVSVLYFFKS